MGPILRGTDPTDNATAPRTRSVCGGGGGGGGGGGEYTDQTIDVLNKTS